VLACRVECHWSVMRMVYERQRTSVSVAGAVDLRWDRGIKRPYARISTGLDIRWQNPFPAARRETTPPCCGAWQGAEVEACHDSHARKENAMSGIGDFQKQVNNTIGSDLNFQIDRAHAGKAKHVDLTARIPGLGADKAEVDFNGNVLRGSTQIGPTKMKW